MRTSSYNILVNVDSKLNLFAILNGYTQAFDVVNEDVYWALKTGQKLEDLPDVILSKLKKRGYVTPLTKSEEIKLVQGLSDRARENHLFQKYNFHFIVSYACNLRCIYCYEDNILNGCNSLSKRTMTLEQVDKAFEIITEKDKVNQSSKTIALYGGEPLLRENYDVISYIVEKGKRIDHTFRVTSNGYDIDAYAFMLQKNSNLFSFQITVDGVEEIQNQRKPHFKNSDSFMKITNNIDFLLKCGIPVNVRINSDLYTINKIHNLLSFFEDKGWYKYKNFRAYCALLRQEVDVKQQIQHSQMGQLDLLKYYNDKIKNKEITERKIFCQDCGTLALLKNLLLNRKHSYKGSFCGAQTNNIIFDPFGDLYSCWDVVGLPEHRVGRYIPDFCIDDTKSIKWFGHRVSDTKCIQCKFVLFCGGGCLVRSLRKSGEISFGNCNEYPQSFKYLMKTVCKEILENNYDVL